MILCDAVHTDRGEWNRVVLLNVKCVNQVLSFMQKVRLVP